MSNLFASKLEGFLFLKLFDRAGERTRQVLEANVDQRSNVVQWTVEL